MREHIIDPQFMVLKATETKHLTCDVNSIKNLDYLVEEGLNFLLELYKQISLFMQH